MIKHVTPALATLLISGSACSGSFDQVQPQDQISEDPCTSETRKLLATLGILEEKMNRAENLVQESSITPSQSTTTAITITANSIRKMLPVLDEQEASVKITCQDTGKSPGGISGIPEFSIRGISIKRRYELLIQNR